MRVTITETERIELGIPVRSTCFASHYWWTMRVDHRCLRRYKRKAKPRHVPIYYKGAKIYWDKPYWNKPC